MCYRFFLAVPGRKKKGFNIRLTHKCTCISSSSRWHIGEEHYVMSRPSRPRCRTKLAISDKRKKETSDTGSRTRVCSVKANRDSRYTISDVDDVLLRCVYMCLQYLVEYVALGSCLAYCCSACFFFFLLLYVLLACFSRQFSLHGFLR